MSEPANETLHAPTLPPPSGSTPTDLPAPTPAPLPLGDGEFPRLAQTSIATPHRREVETPVVTPPLSGTDLPTLPDRPTLPPAAPQESPAGPAPSATPSVQPDAAGADRPDTDDRAEPGAAPAGSEGQEHPMAHLMMTKASATEASKRAAAIRAEKKAKARKIKIGLAIGFLVFAATVGPFLGRWVIDGINEVGNTSTEEP